jgi:GTPase SAR1 family protein
LPQLVVCGDQSAGKSSVLEALTEIPFPRDENLCTRYATEIILRRAVVESLTIKILPGNDRTPAEQAEIKTFTENITDFDDLPLVIGAAKEVMGISGDASGDNPAFANDVLSVTIEGPSRPQLTLVDIPGLIGTATKGVTDKDLELVADITERYISQPRTICLAVVSASSDYATQSILKKVRVFDPTGERTLGIITKPDRIEGNGTKKAFVELAQNQDVVFKQGWHVLKNRGPGDTSSHQERNRSETRWFREDPVFKVLPPHMIGIDALRHRLSVLLFEHVKRELPQLRRDLEDKLEDARRDLKAMGTRRTTPAECKDYLSRFSSEFQGICKAAVDGHYEGRYFRKYTSPKYVNQPFDITTPSTYCRVRALVQSLNTDFSGTMRDAGHKYEIDWTTDRATPSDEDIETNEYEDGNYEEPTNFDERLQEWLKKDLKSIPMTKKQAIEWVHQSLIRTRGKELVGSFNPLLIGELFWEQSSNWARLAADHTHQVSDVCSRFLSTLLDDKCPRDVRSRIWESIKDQLRVRKENADLELVKIMDDLRNYPINYNHYYTDSITKRRQDRQKAALEQCVKYTMEHAFRHDIDNETDILKSLSASYIDSGEADMEKVSCEEALDCLFAIYKVSPVPAALIYVLPPSFSLAIKSVSPPRRRSN